jgi:cytidine deaminase
MKEITYQFRIKKYTIEEVSKDDQLLIQAAKQVIENAYAPYSKFKVGAAVLLANGEIITGSNQENAAYPSGLCAERVALFYAQSRYPNVAIQSLAITASGAFSSAEFISPCGACRQVMVESEKRGKGHLRILLCNETEVLEINSAADLLPLKFDL